MYSIAQARFCATRNLCAIKRAAFALAAFTTLSLQGGALASPSRGEPRGATDASVSNVRLVDAKLVDKNDRDVNFPQDVVGDRIVVVNFIFTSCQTLCPLASATFKLMQDGLGAHMGKDVRLITLTLDPRTDNPQRLRDYADQFEPGPDWLWLTGKAAEVESVLQGFGVSGGNVAAHAPVTLIGDATSGRWTQINVQATPAQIEAEVMRLIAVRGARAPSRGQGMAAP